MLPKLLVFAPCERLVIGAEGDNSATLVALLQGFSIAAETPTTPTPATSDATPLIPMTWYVFALWENDYSQNKRYQRFELRSPRGKVTISGEGLIEFQPDKRFQRWNIKIAGFPLDGVGDYSLALSVKTDDGEFIERATFPIPIQYAAAAEIK